MAVGATSTNLLRLVIGDGIRVALIGVMIGLVGAVGLNRLVASLLFGVQPTDVPTLSVVAATITLVAILASWLPARRATKVDPLIALRSE